MLTGEAPGSGGFLLYGIVESSRSGATPAGIDGLPVDLVSHGRVAAAVSRVARSFTPARCPENAGADAGRAAVAALSAYSDTVVALHGDGPILPTRYGTAVESFEFLRARHDELAERLHEVAGREELGVRALLTPAVPGEPHRVSGLTEPVQSGAQSRAAGPDTDPLPASRARAGSGRAYLEARRRRAADADAVTAAGHDLARRLQSALGGLFVRACAEVTASGRPGLRAPTLSLSFLVDRAGVGAFRHAFAALAARDPAPMLLTGPWPPYSFADA